MRSSKTIYIIYDKEELTACAAWTPQSYVSSYSNNNEEGEGTTSTKSHVKNVALNEGWKLETYAKPTDKIEWLHCYYPGVQKVAYNWVTRNHRDDEDSTDCSKYSRTCSSIPSYSLNNIPFKDFIAWSNRYHVYRGFDSFNYSWNNGVIGNADVQEYNDKTYTVELRRVGESLEEKIETGGPSWAKTWKKHGAHSWNCDWKLKGQEQTGVQKTNCKTDAEGNEVCEEKAIMTDVYGWGGTCSHSETYYQSDSRPEKADSGAVVKVPYNFNAKTIMDEDDLRKDEQFFAGESSQVKTRIVLMPKINQLTSPSRAYATRIKDAKWKLRLCYDNDGSEQCYETKEDKGDLEVNAEEMWEEYYASQEKEGKEFDKQIGFYIPDLPAGTEICLSTAVYPSSSGEDNNLNPAGNDTWSEWSTKRCFRVYKRPSMQVIGGNVYSAGSIVTSLSTKNLIAGYYGSNQSLSNRSDAAPRTFGSWGELGVIAKGSVKGFASGASLGYASLDVTALSPDPFAAPPKGNLPGGNLGGNSSSQYCDALSPLTIAGSCKNGFGGHGNQGNSDNRIVLDYNSIKAMAEGLKERDNKNGTDVVIKDGEIKGNFDGTGAISYERSQFDIISSKDNIKIMHNIKISDEAYFETLSQIPKLVIYTEKDIEIGCEVERIDAILVAGGTVSTCKVENFGGLDENNRKEGDENLYDGVENHEDYSKKQLVVNGAIIAKKLDASRTYGASTGSNSMIPAELINFDPTLYLWNTAAADASGYNEEQSGLKGDLTVTFISELAPRY